MLKWVYNLLFFNKIDILHYFLKVDMSYFYFFILRVTNK